MTRKLRREKTVKSLAQRRRERVASRAGWSVMIETAKRDCSTAIIEFEQAKCVYLNARYKLSCARGAVAHVEHLAAAAIKPIRGREAREAREARRVSAAGRASIRRRAFAALALGANFS